ncbi:MAG: serine/threonine protein kinase, partial [Cyanobacteriota bacterium]|nr:serine/threonine protein kinase [Cyanobacteriota bacterium]
YAAATEYLGIARELLEKNSWSERYKLTLNIYLESVEAAYLNTNFKEAQNLIEIILEQAANLLDRIQAYEVQMQMYIAQLEMVKAIQTGLQVLEMLGVELETELPAKVDFDRLENLPKMTDPTKLAAMRILSAIVSPIFIAEPELFPKVAATMVTLSMRSGNSALSAYGYVLYAWLLCGFVGDFDRGYQFGQASLKLLEKFQAKELYCRVFCVFYSFVSFYKNHVKTTIKPLLNAFQGGMETGDLEYSCYSLIDYCFHLFAVGAPLKDIESECSRFSQILENLQQGYSVVYLKAWRVISLALMNDLNAKTLSQTKKLLEQEIASATTNYNPALLFNCYSAKTVLTYFFNENENAIANSQLALNYKDAAAGLMTVPTVYFYYSLALLASTEQGSADRNESSWERIAENQAKMQHWAKHAPMNFQHKWDLVEAERYRVLGKRAEAIEHYDRAIQGAKENGYLHEEALANELAAQFYGDWGKEKIARDYALEAYYGYARWGAKAKTDDLEQRYPQLLAPILQPEKAPYSAKTTATLSAGTIHSSTTTNSPALLDLATVLKASQLLSREIELDKLLSTLMQIAIANAGADRGALVLRQERQWKVAIRYNAAGDCTLESTPLDVRADVPIN